jgi:hypothetical protein
VRGWLSRENARTKFHFRPQSSFILDHAGRKPLDSVARFESLERDFETICRTLGVSARLCWT